MSMVRGTKGCQHRWCAGGMRYYDSSRPIPGTGAHQRFYAYHYFCDKCLGTKGLPIADPNLGGDGRPSYTTYEEPRFGATPGTADECNVPEYSR